MVKKTIFIYLYVILSCIFLIGCSFFYKENNTDNYLVNYKENIIIINGVQYNKTDIAFSYCEKFPFYEKTIFFNYKSYRWVLENEIVMLEENYGHFCFYIRDEKTIDELYIDYIILLNGEEFKYSIIDNKLEEYTNSELDNKTSLKTILDQDYYDGSLSEEDKYLDLVICFTNNVKIMGDIYCKDGEYYFDYYREELEISKHRFRKIKIELP